MLPASGMEGKQHYEMGNSFTVMLQSDACTQKISFACKNQAASLFQGDVGCRLLISRGPLLPVRNSSFLLHFGACQMKCVCVCV